jgi:hypothetical protein
MDASEIFLDAVAGAPEFVRARLDPSRNDVMTAGPRNAATKIDLFCFMLYRFLDAVAETCASFNFRAQSSQHTSTVLPPILTLMEFLSNLQSQAAQVVSTMASLSHTRSPGARAVGHAARERRCQNL